MTRHYRIGEVAAATRVSVRTLRHYDRIGLLRPAGYSEGSQRLYGERELLMLQQILTLRYLGFSLKQIGALLERSEFDLLASMRVQRVTLQERIDSLERVEQALAALLARREQTGCWDWALVAGAAAAAQTGFLERSEAMEQAELRYTPEQMEQLKAVATRLAPGERERVEDDWLALLRAVRQNRDLDPASVAAQQLAARWHTLTEATLRPYQANPELIEAIRANYAREAFKSLEGAPSKEDFAFIALVNAARKADSAG